MSEFYEEVNNTSSDYADRYRRCKILKDVSTGEVVLSTREIGEIRVTSNDKYHRLRSHEIGRLDILAAMYYRNPHLWWVIAQANDIFDPFNKLNPGDLLRIPDIETLYGNGGILL